MISVMHGILKKKKEKKKRTEKIFQEIIVENFPNMGKEIIKSRKHRASIQDKSKEKHVKTHIKLSKIKYKEEILKGAREK